MKKNWITLIIGTAIALGIYTIPAITQQQPASPQQEPLPYIVAVVDVAQIIQSHPDYVQQQESLKKRALAAEAEFEKRRESITNKKKNLDASPYKAGSPEHQRIVDEIANDMADFEKDMKTQQRKFILENSKIMYDTYKNIKDTIGRIASQAGIAQVTDYRDFEPNPAEPQTVIDDMDQRLVWFHSRLNITQAVIQRLYAERSLPMPAQQTANGGAAGAAPAARTAAAPAPGAAQPQPAPTMMR